MLNFAGSALKGSDSMADDRINSSYRQSRNIYDDVITQGPWWSRLYNRLFWAGVRDWDITQAMLARIPADFSGKILDVPAGTAVFTWEKYKELSAAEITCLDKSPDMLAQARARFQENDLNNIKTIEGDVGCLPFDDGAFDIVLSMNGFHAFPDKDAAAREMRRVLRPGGQLIACFYIRGKSRRTDWLVNSVLARKGWFTPPFETEESLRQHLSSGYRLEEFCVRGSLVWFCAVKL